MDEATYQKMTAAQERYHSEAMRIPGVHGTSVGLKHVKGQITDDFAICIHVTKKKPLDALSADEIIPEEIEGFPTDVVEHEQVSPYEDNSKRRPVEGGIQIQVADHYGTLGCIVRDKTDKALCALSNRHVLLDSGQKVFQPKSDPVCDQIGFTKRSVMSADVDGGISTLDEYGVTALARIVEIGDVAGVYTVTAADLPYPVQKRGRTTLLTKGRITNLNFHGRRTDNWSFRGQQFIVHDGGSFAEPGDSGSAVVDNQQRVVGLLWGGALPDGAASPIDKVLSELDIDVSTRIDEDPLPPYSETVNGRLEALLKQSDRGQSYWKAYRQHRTRVLHMFHEIPRLHAIWRRIPQVELVDAVQRGILDPESEIPATIGCEDTVSVLTRLRDGLARYVRDGELQQQIASLFDTVAGNIGESWREALAKEPTKVSLEAPADGGKALEIVVRDSVTIRIPDGTARQTIVDALAAVEEESF